MDVSATLHQALHLGLGLLLLALLAPSLFLVTSVVSVLLWVKDMAVELGQVLSVPLLWVGVRLVFEWDIRADLMLLIASNMLLLVLRQSPELALQRLTEVLRWEQELLSALCDSLTGPVLRVTEMLVAFLTCVSSRATPTSNPLWSHFQLCFMFLCFSTGIYLLFPVCLLGIQSLFSLVVALWHLLAGLVLGVTELLVIVLVCTFRLVLNLLWLPFQLVYKVLSFNSRVFATIFFNSVHIVRFHLWMVFVVALLCVAGYNWEWLWELMEHPLGHLWQDLRRLCRVAIAAWQGNGHGRGLPHLGIDPGTISRAWHRLVTSWSQRGRTMNQGSVRQGAVPRPPPARGRLLARARGHGDQLDAGGTPDHNPWVLLSEQEERKKCVICQDQTKTVLLLPCRHLCLCQECTEVLLQRDTDQRNCPLCRQMILQTLNVYL